MADHMSKVEQESNPVDELNYYHLTLNNIPIGMPVPEVAELIQVQQDSEEIKEIKEVCGYDVVPHQLHVFKETLPTKYAMFTYYLKPIAIVSKLEVEEVDDRVISKREKAHDIFVKYMQRISKIRGSGGGDESIVVEESGKGDGVKTVSMEIDANEEAKKREENEGGVIPKKVEEKEASNHSITLAQPEYVRNCLPFFQQVSAAGCEFFNPDLTPDPKKLRTFLLSKVNFFTKEEIEERKAKAAEKRAAAGEEEASATITPIGVLRGGDVSAREWAWLRTQHKGFPQQATSDLITGFFVKHLHPLFVYHDTVTV